MKDDKDKSKVSTAVLDIRYYKLTIISSVEKEKGYDNLDLTVIHAIQRCQPEGRKHIKWRLITKLPVKCKMDTIEKLDWYALRCKIETFHNVLKSGYRAENYKLRSAERLANFIAMMYILAWQVL